MEFVSETENGETIALKMKQNEVLTFQQRQVSAKHENFDRGRNGLLIPRAKREYFFLATKYLIFVRTITNL